jgi:hypothetical protein
MGIAIYYHNLMPVAPWETPGDLLADTGQHPGIIAEDLPQKKS